MKLKPKSSNKIPALNLKIKNLVLFFHKKLVPTLKTITIRLKRDIKKFYKKNYAKPLLLFLLLLIVASGFVLFSVLNVPNQEIKENIEVDPTVISISTDSPNEEKEEVPITSVRKDEPWKIEISSINSDGYIQKVGIDQNNQIAVPNNIYKVGWYVNSVKPGDRGLSIIAGHLNGRTRNAIFYELNKVKVGDEILITYGDNSIRKFQVVETKSVVLEESFNILFAKKKDIPNQLNLISCTGTYIPDQKTYDHRMIVITKFIE